MPTNEIRASRLRVGQCIEIGGMITTIIQITDDDDYLLVYGRNGKMVNLDAREFVTTF